MEKKNFEMNRTNSNLAEVVNTLTTDKTNLEKELSEKKSESKDLSEALIFVRNEKEKIQNERNILEETKNALADDLYSMQTLLEHEREQLKGNEITYQNEKSKILTENQILHDEKEKLDEKVNKLEKTIIAMSKHDESLKISFEDMKKISEQKQTEFQTERETLQNAADNLTADLDMKAKQNTLLTEQVRNLKMEEVRHIKDNARLNEENSKMITELERLKFENEESDSKIELLIGEIEQMKADNNKHEKASAEKDSFIIQKEEEIGKGKAQTQKDGKLIQKLKLRNLQLTGIVNQHDQKIEDAAKEISKLNIDLGKNIKENGHYIELLNKQKVSSKKDKENYEELIDSLKQELQSGEKVTEFLKQELEDMSKRFTAETESAKSLAAEIYEKEKVYITENEKLRQLSLDLQNQITDIGKSSDIMKVQLTKSITDFEQSRQNEMKLADENKNLKVQVAEKTAKINQDETLIGTLKQKLDVSTVLLKEKANECENNRVSLDIVRETNSVLESNLQSVTEQKEKLGNAHQALTKDMTQLQKNFLEFRKSNESTLLDSKLSYQKKLEKLQDDTDLMKNTHKEEIHELMQNFGELETELGYCQDELAAKTDELAAKTDEVLQLKKELSKLTSMYSTKEKDLLRELRSLNEQNELILQNEIAKFKTECDEKLLSHREKSSQDISEIQRNFRKQLEKLKEQYEQTKHNENDIIKKSYEEQLALKHAERENLEGKIKSYEGESHAYDLILKNKNQELESKTKAIEKLHRRVETQQKLIDYAMKALEQERSRNGKTNDEILFKLNELQNKVNDKLESLSEPLSNHSLLSSTVHPEHTFPQQRFPTLSMQSDIVLPDNFTPLLSSIPDQKKRLSQSLPWVGFNEKSDVHDKLAHSLPESGFHEIGFHNTPTRGVNLHSIYFADQMKSISKTFEHINNTTFSSENEINLEVWKQKIHFRLRVLENQMSQMENGSVVSQNTHRSSLLSLSLPEINNSDDVMFNPSNDEIRQLIQNINQRYENLQKLHSRR